MWTLCTTTLTSIRGAGSSNSLFGIKPSRVCQCSHGAGQDISGSKSQYLTLKPVLCAYQTQTAQAVVEHVPSYSIYNHSSCKPKNVLPSQETVRQERNVPRQRVQDLLVLSEHLSSDPLVSPSPPQLQFQCPRLLALHTRQFLGSFSQAARLFSRSNFLRRNISFSRRLSRELPGAGFSQETIAKAASPPTRKGCK